MSIDGFETEEEDAEAMRVGGDNVVPVDKLINSRRLKSGPAVFEGAFRVWGRFRVWAVSRSIPEATDRLMVSYDGGMIRRVNAKGGECHRGEEGDAVPGIATEAREPAEGSGGSIGKLPLKFVA